MDKYNDYLCIPVELLTFALRNKKVNQVRLFICLKSLYPSGSFKFDDEHIKTICNQLHCHPKSFHANFQWLIGRNQKWVTINKNHCYVKGFKKILLKINYNSRKCVVFYPGIDLKLFRPFLYAVVITYYMMLKRRMERRPGMNNERALMRRLHFSYSYNLPNLYLAKALHISKSCASAYKNTAEKAGYINVSKRFEKYDGKSEHLRFIKKHEDEGISRKIRNLNGILAIQMPDALTSTLILKKKYNLRSLKPKQVA
jgi:hypothetical protein